MYASIQILCIKGPLSTQTSRPVCTSPGLRVRRASTLIFLIKIRLKFMQEAPTDRETSPSAPSFSSKRQWITYTRVPLSRRTCHLQRHQFQFDQNFLSGAINPEDLLKQQRSQRSTPVTTSISSLQTNLLGSVRHLSPKHVTKF